MANTLTNLAPDLYKALDVVSREIVGFIPAVTRDSGVERAALNQVVRSFVAPSSTAADITPGQLPPNTGDQTIGNVQLTIDKSRAVPVRWNGEEQRAMNSGAGYSNILGDQFEQAMRALVNEIESDLGGLYNEASRAVSPSGTTLFDSTSQLAFRDISNVRKILVDNGAPMSDVTLVLNTLAGAALRGNSVYSTYQNAGNTDILRNGVLLDLAGVKIRESAGVKSVTAGTASGATTNNAGYAVGSTVLTLASAGTGTILAGDVVTFQGDTNKYVVVSGDSDVSNGGTITIAAPGLLQTMAASTRTITIDASTDKNMCFSRNAIVLATRAPARPAEGDSAKQVMIIQDPRSGLAFEVSMYAEYRQVHYEIAIAWGKKVVKPEHLALLID